MQLKNKTVQWSYQTGSLGVLPLRRFCKANLLRQWNTMQPTQPFIRASSNLIPQIQNKYLQTTLFITWLFVLNVSPRVKNPVSQTFRHPPQACHLYNILLLGLGSPFCQSSFTGWLKEHVGTVGSPSLWWMISPLMYAHLMFLLWCVTLLYVIADLPGRLFLFFYKSLIKIDFS